MGSDPVLTGVLKRGNLDTDRYRGEHLKTQGEDGHVQAKERRLRRDQFRSGLDLGLPVSRTVRKYQ